MKRVCFTGGGGAGSEALYRLLEGRYEVHFADADPEAIDPAIPADRRHVLPFASDPAFSDQVFALVLDQQLDLLVPGVDEELLKVAELVQQDRIRALLPPAAFIQRHLDKQASMQWLAAQGLPAPRTRPAVEGGEIGFPCIVKPRSGRGSRGVTLIRSPEQLGAYAAWCGQPDEWIAQEYAQGREFTVMVASDAEARLRAVVPVAVEVKRGITLRAQTCRCPEVEEVCRRVHAADPVPGCFNVQLMLQPDGTVRIFEINPRVSTTLCLGVAAGVDPVGLFLDPQPGADGDLLPFKASLRLRRNWINHFEQGGGK